MYFYSYRNKGDELFIYLKFFNLMKNIVIMTVETKINEKIKSRRSYISFKLGNKFIDMQVKINKTYCKRVF